MFNSLYAKLNKNIESTIKTRLLKKLCLLLAKHNLVQNEWLKKPVLRINANLVNHSGPVIDCIINNMQTQACIDSGSTFTIQPYAFFKTLNISLLFSLKGRTIQHNKNIKTLKYVAGFNFEPVYSSNSPSQEDRWVTGLSLF